LSHASPNSQADPAPGWRDLEKIVTEREYAELESVSVDTIRRRSARGEGAPRLRLSPRRVGYRLADIIRHREGC